MALASAFRVSELHALSVDEDCCRFNTDGSVTLQTCVGFVAKNRLASSAPQKLVLQPLPDSERLCPVRHHRLYVDRTAQLRGRNSQLFVSVKKPSSRMTPQLVSTFIRSTVQRAYEWMASQSTAVLRDTTGTRLEAQSTLWTKTEQGG